MTQPPRMAPRTRMPGSVAAQRIASARLSRRKGQGVARRHVKALASASGRRNK